MAHVVDAVCDQKNRLLFVLRPVHVIEGENQRVVDCRLSKWLYAGQCRLQVRNTCREIPVESRLVVEMDDECFVFGIALLDEGYGSRIESLLPRFDAAAVVDHETEAHRQVLVLEHDNFLGNAVLDQLEIVLLQISNGTVTIVGDVDVNLDEIDIHVQFECVLFLRCVQQQGSGEKCENDQKIL